MSYFPAFIQLEDKKILLVGGGSIAHQKLEKLLLFTKKIKIISSEFSNEISKLINENSLSYEKRFYKKGDIKDYFVVVVAVDDIEIQKSIYEESQHYKCLCNTVDSTKYCDFIFPSLVKRGDLTVAVSTSGSSPAFAKHFRTYLEKLIPDDIEIFLIEMKHFRNKFQKGKKRMDFLEKKVQSYIKKWRKV